MSEPGPRPIEAVDELLHAVDPEARTWNESWFLSWIDGDGGPAGFLRVGLLPNQGRVLLWCFVHVDGRWLAIEEGHLPIDEDDLAHAPRYDRFGTRFDWEPDPPLEGAHVRAAGQAMVRSGEGAGGYVSIEVDLTCRSTGPAVRTGTGADDGRTAYPASRFEQPLEAVGSVVVDGFAHPVRAGAHRDRSWGPRDWRQRFLLGDVQGPGRQLYFVARDLPGPGMGFLRDERGFRHLAVVDGAVEVDDATRSFTQATLRLEGAGELVEVRLVPISPSVGFDVSHTCEPPETWAYWRALARAEVSGWAEPARGWFEISRYEPTDES